MAVLLVAVLIVLLNVLFGETASPPGLPAAGRGPVVSSPSSLPLVDEPTPSPSTESPTPTPSPAAPAVSAEPSAEPSPVPADERPPLTVLNYSRVQGLAARAAEDFEDGGWEVVEVGNTRHPTTETTVFYEPGQQDAAAALRAQFPAVRRSAPRPAGLAGSGLTVVVTRDYAG